MALAAAWAAPSLAAAQARSEPSPADISSSIATARAQIARYRYAPPSTGGERCYELKQIVRSLHAGRQTSAQARWQERMRHICTAAHKSPDL